MNSYFTCIWDCNILKFVLKPLPLRMGIIREYLFEYVTSTWHLGLRKKKELRGLSQQANYTNRATAACRRS
jgi:hypothetical protein